MFEMSNEIIVCNSTKTKDIREIEKAIDKLKIQEKKLVDLYLSSTLNVETINQKSEMIKKEIENLNKKRKQIDPDDDFKEYTIELLKKMDCEIEGNEAILKNKLAFSCIFDILNRKAKKELIRRLISSLEIKRDTNYNIEITNIKFTDEFISKNPKEYLEYLNEILQNNHIGIIYKPPINKKELEKLEDDYFVFSCVKMENKEYSKADLEMYSILMQTHFYADGIINCPYIDDGKLKDNLVLISREPVEID